MGAGTVHVANEVFSRSLCSVDFESHDGDRTCVVLTDEGADAAGRVEGWLPALELLAHDLAG